MSKCLQIFVFTLTTAKYRTENSTSFFLFCILPHLEILWISYLNLCSRLCENKGKKMTLENEQASGDILQLLEMLQNT